MRGRNGQNALPLTQFPETVKLFAATVERLNLLNHPEKPLLTGNDLEGIIQKGPELGRILKQAYELQINEHITSKDMLLKRILSEGNRRRQQKTRSDNDH